METFRAFKSRAFTKGRAFTGHGLGLAALALMALAAPVSAFTAVKTVQFPATETGQTVTYAVLSSSGAAVTSGVSGSVVEIGGGAYAASITVPDGAAYVLRWTETTGLNKSAVDSLGSPAVLGAADEGLLTGISAKLGIPATASLAGDIAAANAATLAAQLAATTDGTGITAANSALSALSAALALVQKAGQPVTLPALPPVTVGGYAAGQDPFSLVMAGAVLTIPSAGTTTGVSEVLTGKQLAALHASMSAGGAASTAVAASSSATVTYYLLGQPQAAGNVVAVSTPTFDASKVTTGRTVLIAQPFPAIN